MRRYTYVGPAAIRDAARSSAPGTPVRDGTDLAPFAPGEPLTFVVGADGLLRVAPRRSEHVACAGGGDVLSAGELTFVRASDGSHRVVEVSNLSTGYCPEPESWTAVAAALEGANIRHPGRFTYEAVFRRCPKCGERNVVKESWFECAICGSELPAAWNF